MAFTQSLSAILKRQDMPIVKREDYSESVFNFRGNPYPISFDIDMDKEYCALYYPCEIDYDINSENAYKTLKHALLFFDKIFVVVPELVFSDYFSSWIDMTAIDEELIKKTNKYQTTEYILWRERFRRLRSFIDATKAMVEEGILFYVNPAQIMNQKSQTHFYSLPNPEKVDIKNIEDYTMEIVFNSIVNDLNDSNYRSIVTKGFPYQHNGFAVFKDQGEINWLNMLAGSSNFKEDRMINLYTPISNNTIIPPPGVGFDSIVSPCLGISVFLSHVLSFSLSNNVHPITDSRYYQSLLNYKFKKIFNDGGNNLLLKKYGGNLKMEIGAVGMKLLDVELPKLDFRSFEDVLGIRNKFKSNLERFRIELAKFSQFSVIEPWDNNFESKCNEIITYKIRPAIQELRDEIDNSKDKIVLKVLKDLRSLKPVIPLIGTYLSGIPIIYALAISAGLISLETYLEYHFDTKKIKKKGLSYILDLQK